MLSKAAFWKREIFPQSLLAVLPDIALTKNLIKIHFPRKGQGTDWFGRVNI